MWKKLFSFLSVYTVAFTVYFSSYLSLALKSSSFLIFRSQEGVYTCEAYNSHGMATLHLTLEVVYPPSCTLTKEVTYTWENL
jgi:hypothetical protein